MANTKINTTELDFDGIKTNLKEFLRSQDTFKDYDFEGSAMNTLLDVLAYNTHYNALYTNLAINESFLDSASKRSNIVSRAKEVGYVPHSATSPVAVVDLVVTPSSIRNFDDTLVLPAYQPFLSTIDGIQFTFYNLEASTAFLNRTTNTYTFPNTAIYEGNLLTFSYVVNQGTRFIIPNENVDLATLKVRVAENQTSTTRTTWTRQENLLNLNSESKVYFVKEIEGELYELEFGNDVIGKSLSVGNIVEMTYLTTNKDAGNGAKTFIYSGATLVAGSTQVTTQVQALGGADIEDITSIRYNAPRSYASQNRTVTSDDYKTFLYKIYKEAEAISVWGGEDNVPKQYGKVFISVKPKNAGFLTQSQKDYITQLLKEKNVVSITPEIVNPEYINVAVSANVYYNPRLTSLTANELKTLVIQTIKDYNDDYLGSFTGILKHSNLSTAIDTCEDSVISNITNFKLHREIVIQYDTEATYTININNPIYGSGVPEESVKSTGFYIQGNENVMYIEDLPTNKTDGTLRMYYYDENNNKVYMRNFGSVNYPTGTIIIPSLNIVGIDLVNSQALEIIITPQSNDIVSIRNQLVYIPDNQIFVNLIVDTVALGDSAGGSNYQFTSSRS